MDLSFTYEFGLYQAKIFYAQQLFQKIVVVHRSVPFRISGSIFIHLLLLKTGGPKILVESLLEFKSPRGHLLVALRFTIPLERKKYTRR
jgi:hypothetical protein